MGKEEKGKRGIPNLHEAIVISVCLSQFSHFPFFLITHSVSSFGLRCYEKKGY